MANGLRAVRPLGHLIYEGSARPGAGRRARAGTSAGTVSLVLLMPETRRNFVFGGVFFFGGRFFFHWVTGFFFKGCKVDVLYRGWVMGFGRLG